MTKSIPFSLIRGGSSKAVFFLDSYLPKDESLRQAIILDIMEGAGHGDVRQIDGLGGADSLTTKVAVVAKSDVPGVDLDYQFYQVVIGEARLSTAQNCGNILSGVLPFALQENLCSIDSGTTTKTIKMLNSGSLCEVTVQTPNRILRQEGEVKVDGVLGTGAPIICKYIGISGANTGALLPTGNERDLIEGIEVTCVDNGMPTVILRASDLDISGYEPKAKLDKNETLKSSLEKIRLVAGKKMNLGDVTQLTVPKMAIISAPVNGGWINTRTFIPHVCHTAIGVLGAVSAATGAYIKGSVADDVISKTDPTEGDHQFEIEHPSGSFIVNLSVEKQEEQLKFIKSGVIRTARIIASGKVFLP